MIEYEPCFNFFQEGNGAVPLALFFMEENGGNQYFHVTLFYRMEILS